MSDRPTAAELVEAVRHLLEAEVIPTLTDTRLRFQSLVAANVLAIVERELLRTDKDGRLEWVELAAILGQNEPPPHSCDRHAAVHQLNEQLCQQIRAGDFDDPARFAELLQQLGPLVVRKLEIANPRLLASYEAL